MPRKFLVVVDDSPEFSAALRYASRRARSTGGRVALLRVLRPSAEDYFPGVRDWAIVDLVVAKDLDHRALYQRTKLTSDDRPAPAADEPDAPAHVAEPSFISLAEFRRTQARAERAN